MTHLTYEAYVPLALKTLGALFAEARALPPPEPFSHAAPHACCARSGPHSHPATAPDARIELSKLHVSHLLGPSPPKTPSIVVSVSSPHRREAFFVAEWLLERVKERVQVWKREWYADGDGDGGEGQPGFVGRDGDGPEGRGGRAGAGGHGAWKENFPPVEKRGADGAVRAGTDGGTATLEGGAAESA